MEAWKRAVRAEPLDDSCGWSNLNPSGVDVEMARNAAGQDRAFRSQQESSLTVRLHRTLPIDTKAGFSAALFSESSDASDTHRIQALCIHIGPAESGTTRLPTRGAPRER